MLWSRRIIIIATTLAVVLAAGTVAGAGEGGQHSVQREKLKAEWAEARARNAARPHASLIERVFGSGRKRVAGPPGSAPATAPAGQKPKPN